MLLLSVTQFLLLLHHLSEKMDSICCFRPFYHGISVLSAFGLSSKLSSVNSFHSKTSLRFGRTPNSSFKTQAKKSKKNSNFVEPKTNKVEDLLFDEEEEEEEELILPEDIQDELLLDDEYDEEDDFEFNETEDELYAGDGSGGGGIKFAGTLWDKEAFSLAEKALESFNGDLAIYAFKTLLNSTIQVRIERLTNKSGSPTMEDIEAYSTIYRAKLAEAELTKSIPDNISLEVSSPGVERVVRIPQDLDRYKERPMYVRYINEETKTEGDGIFRLVSFDVENKSCVWGVADIRVNREKAGKGRPLSKKQREWRLQTGFESLRLVRLHSEC